VLDYALPLFLDLFLLNITYALYFYMYAGAEHERSEATGETSLAELGSVRHSQVGAVTNK